MAYGGPQKVQAYPGKSPKNLLQLSRGGTWPQERGKSPSNKFHPFNGEKEYGKGWTGPH